VIDPIQTLNDSQTLLRKVSHSMRHEVSKRLLVDVESLLGSIAMLEVETKQRDNEKARTPESYRHD